MAFNVGTGLDFGALKKMPVKKRVELMRQNSDIAATSLSGLTPAQFAELFPRYWQKALPDIGGFRDAISKKFIQRQEDINTGLSKKAGITVQEAERIGRTERLKQGVPDVMDVPARVDKSSKKVGKPAAGLTPSQEKAFEKIKSGNVEVNSEEGKSFSKLSDKELSSIGITREKDNTGRDVFKYSQPEVGKEEAVSRLKTTGGDKAILNMISKAEGTTKHGYNDAFGHQTHGDLSQMTVSEVMKLQSGQKGSSAIGKYQFMKDTLNGFLKKGTITPDTKFTPELQDRLAVELMREKGLDKWRAGKMSDKEFMHNISTTWAGLTDPYTGKSHYEGVGLNKSTGFSIAEQQAALDVGKSAAEKPQGPNNQYSDEQINRMTEQLKTEKNEARKQQLVNLLESHGVNVAGVEAGADVTSVKLTGKTTGHKGAGVQCADLSKFYAPGIGHAGDWKFHKGQDGMVPGAVIATTNYGNGNGGKEAKAFGGVSHFHTGVLLTRPDANGNALIYDQARGHGARITRVNVNNYNGTGTPMAVINGGESSDKSRQAIEDARAQASPAELAAIKQAEQGQVAAIPTETQDAAKVQEEATGPDNIDHDNQPVKAETQQQPTAVVEKPKEKEAAKPELPNRYNVSRENFIASIKATDEFKNTTGSFLATEGMIISGFNDDARTKAAGIRYDEATGQIVIKDPNNPNVKGVLNDFKSVMTPAEKRAEAEAIQTTQTATVGEKLQREFGVASAQASTGQGDAFAREEAYRKTHPYGPEMPAETKISGGVTDKIEKTAGVTGLRPNSKLIDYTSNATVPAVGISNEQYNAFRESVASIESRGGLYGLQGGGGKKYDGAYQFNANAKKDANKTLGAKIPSREEFRKNPMLQEQLFDHYVAFNHRVLMQKSKIYRNLSPEKKLEALGYAHNQGAGGASKWLRTGQSQRDGFGTDATKYANTINKELAALKQSQALEAKQMAQAETVKTTEAPKTVTTPEAPKTASPLGPLGSSSAAAAEAPMPTTQTTSTPKQETTEVKKTPDVPTPNTVNEPTPNTVIKSPAPEFPKPKVEGTPTPPVRPPEITPQAGAPDESSSKNFLRSQGIPGASDGGKFKVDNQPISFYPMDKRDNIAAVNPVTQKPLFTAKTGETVSVNPEQKIKLSDKPIDKVGSEIESLRNEMTSIMERQSAGEPIKQTTNKLMGEIPQKPVTIDPFLKQKTVGFPTPSLERAMSRTRGGETGSGTDGHHFSRTSIA